MEFHIVECRYSGNNIEHSNIGVILFKINLQLYLGSKNSRK